MGYIIGFLATAAYWPGITGAAINTVWVALALALAAASITAKDVATAFVGIAVAACLACFVTGAQSFEAAWHYAVVGLTLAFAVSSDKSVLGSACVGAVVGISLSLIASAFYVAGVPIVAQQSGPMPAGLFVNPLFYGIVSALLVVACCQIGRFNLACVALIGVVISGSRTGWAVLAAASLHWLWHNNRQLFAAATIFIAIFIVPFIVMRPETLSERFNLWQAVVYQLKWFGNGLGAVPDFTLPGNRVAEHAHSAALQIVFECGLFGFGAVLLLAFGAFKTNSPFAVAAIFTIVVCEAFQQPSIAFLCVLAVGDALRVGHRHGVAGAKRGPNTGARVQDAGRSIDPDRGMGFPVQ